MDTMLKIAKGVDDFILERSPVHDTMRRLVQALKDLNISFAIAGAMAANAHGLRRTGSQPKSLKITSSCSLELS